MLLKRIYSFRQHRLKQNTFVEMLKVFDRVMKKENLTYWAEGGTMLGALRHQGFIPWDMDIDLGTTLEEVYRMIAVKEALENSGLTIVLYVDGNHYKLGEPTAKEIVFGSGKGDWHSQDIHIFLKIVPLNSSLTFDNYGNRRYDQPGPYLDIFPFYQNQENYWEPTAFFEWYKVKQVRIKSIEPLMDVRFETLTLKLPIDSMTLLAQYYGVDCLVNNDKGMPVFPVKRSDRFLAAIVGLIKKILALDLIFRLHDRWKTL